MQPLTLLVGLTGLLAALPGRAEDPAEYEPLPSEMDDLVYDVARASSKAKSTGSDARAVAAEVASGMAAEDTIGSQFEADKLARENGFNEPFMQGTKSESADQATFAAKAKTSTENTVGASQLMQTEAVGDAAAWAAAETQRQLQDVYKGLQDWRFQVLHDPVSEAKMAAQRAAAPFNKALAITEKRVDEYQQRATSMQQQAFGLQKVAQTFANLAVGAQSLGAYGPAQANMKSAHQMMMQASRFGAQAAAIQAQAETLQMNQGAYQQGALMSATKAAHRYDPADFGPAGVPGSVGAAAAPVPNPNDVSLAQRRSAARRALRAARTPVRARAARASTSK